MRRALVLGWIVVGCLGGCGGDDPPVDDAGDAAVDAMDADGSTDATDVGVDVPPPVPLGLSLDSGRVTLEIESDPGRLRLRLDGEVVLESASSLFEVGRTRAGDDRYRNPIESATRGVDFTAYDVGVESTDETSARIRDDIGQELELSLSEVREGVVRLRITAIGDDVALTRARFAMDDGSYQGLGERFTAADARGETVPMQFAVADAQARTSGTNEHHVPVPFVVNSNGWGLFAESRLVGAFDVGETDADVMALTFEGPALDLVFFATDSPSETIAAYTQHTGLPRLPPRWAFAPMHWRNEWESRDVLEEDMRRIREEGIPTTSFWIDNPWQISYNDSRFDETRFPDSVEMLELMRELGFVPLVWSTPYLDLVDEGEEPSNPAEELFVQAREDELLVRRRGEIYASPAAPGATGAMMDFTAEEARRFWQDQLDPLIALGVRAFKLDYGEDIVPDLLGSRPGFEFADGTSERETHGVYNILYHQPYRDAIDEGAPDDGGFLLVRGSTWGGQVVADIVWPGDLNNDLREAGSLTEGLNEVGGLPAAISGMISLAASGFPAFGSDTGGYLEGMPEREDLLRWAEHTALSPIMQLGGAGEHHNPWLYDDEAGDIYRRLARTHMDLVPYLRMLALAASSEGIPPILHPALAYPDDRAGYADPHAYMIGPDMFVASVVLPGATTRDVHLPPGRWVHYFEGTLHEGDVTVDAPLGGPPVFLRQGTLLPLSPSDLETLVATEGLVSPDDRGFIRARAIPMGVRTIDLEEGARLMVDHDAERTVVQITPEEDGVNDVRFAIDLAHASPAISLSSVSLAETVIDAAESAEAVQAGCDDACWFVEDDTLWLSMRSPEAATVTLR